MGKIFGNPPQSASLVTQERFPTRLSTSGPMNMRLSGVPHLGTCAHVTLGLLIFASGEPAHFWLQLLRQGVDEEGRDLKCMNETFVNEHISYKETLCVCVCV